MSEPRPVLAPRDFRRFVELNAPPERLFEDPQRRQAFHAILEETHSALAEGAAAFVAGLPRTIGLTMAPFGWLWNGFYVLGDDGRLHLGPAHGPPVCTPLEARGGALTSGMCFDALRLNQTLAAHDVSLWPGYVSCDAASGLGTVASIVCPVRDADGTPLAVWDLDATLPIEAGDVRFLDVLFASAARSVDFTPALLARAASSTGP